MEVGVVSCPPKFVKNAQTQTERGCFGQRTHKENERAEGELNIWALPLHTKHPNGVQINPWQRQVEETRKVESTWEKIPWGILCVRSWTNTPVVLKSLFEKKVMGKRPCERVRRNMSAFSHVQTPRW